LSVRLLAGESEDRPERIDGSLTPLTFFSLYLASLVVFKFFFGLLYIIKWKFRQMCSRPYQHKTFNLDAEFKKVKNNKYMDDSDEEDELENEEYEEK
jgi:cytoskeletal protein RodZ